MKTNALAAFVVALVVAGCSSADPQEPTDTQGAELHSCVDTVLCIQGYTWSRKSCSCVPDKQHSNNGGGGVACGTGKCGAGQYCCNSSCGTCAPIGSMCTMIACTSL